MSALDAEILAAHDRGDHRALVTLYAQAAEGAEGPAVPFFLTQSWIFALETGAPEAPALEDRLRALHCA